MRHQIALAVALLGVSSMLCLELMKKVGRRLEEQQKKKENTKSNRAPRRPSLRGVCLPFS